MIGRLIFKFVLSVVILLLLYVCIVSIVYAHEMGHVAINMGYGYESEVVMGNFGFSGQTIPVGFECSVFNKDVCLSLLEAQSLHETYSYTWLPVIFIFLSLFCCGLVLYVWSL